MHHIAHKAALASLIAASTLAFASPSADADTPRCVSRHEYARVVKGMTMNRVHAIFDTAGDATGLGAPNQVRYYRPCTAQGLVQVTFSPRSLVVSKSAHWFG